MAVTAKTVLSGLTLAAMLALGAPALAEKTTVAESARTELLRRAQAGEVAVYDVLAADYLNAKGERRDVAAAVRWLKAGVKAGDTECMIDLGNLYYEGRALEQDDAKALALYVAAAGKGDALGAYNAGLVFETSVEDITQAVGWYRRAAAGGDQGGMYKVALAYQLGRGVAADEAQAVSWMTRAAQAGSADALNDLGDYHAQGYGVEANAGQALALYRAAARAGSAVAMANIADAYRDGEGVAVDAREAVTWYKLAIRGGDLVACYHLGQMYEDGEGVKASAAKAAQLYRVAAQSDDEAVAQAAEDALERLESGSSETPTA